MPRFALPVTGVLALAATLVTAAPAQAAPAHVQGDHTVPVYAATITETVSVESPVDGDGDGRNDLINVQVYRPETSVKVPVVIHASPYFGKSRPKPDNVLVTTLVPRGYAVAFVDLSGTGLSKGCDDVGARLEVTSGKAVVDWLNDRVPGFKGGSPVKASTWSTGAAAMTGVSWDGTIANAVAATGVEGLKTIIPTAAISSWYDYTRSQGVPNYKDHVKLLHEYVSNFTASTCRTLTGTLNTAADDSTGDYNDWWAERDYTRLASKIKASVLVVHGLSDENVKTLQFGRWWDALVANNVPRKLFLHQGDHVSGFSYGSRFTDLLIPWLDHWLMGLDNGIMTKPQATIQREDKSTWVQDAVWPLPDTRKATYGLRVATSGALVPEAAGSGTGTITTTRTPSSDSDASAPATGKANRLAFQTEPLAAQQRLNGTTQVTIRVKSDRALAAVTARLVDYTSSGYTVFARTTASVGHAQSLSKRVQLDPNTWYTLTFSVNTEDYVFAKGHSIGLALSGDVANPHTTFQTTKLTVDGAASKVVLPLSGPTGQTRSAAAPVNPTRMLSTENRLDLETALRQMRDAAFTG